MFCLIADVEIRKKTHNTMGLEAALRGIVDAGGNIETDWGMSRVLETGDRAIGIPVLVPLYNKMKENPSPVDLDELWKQLGVIEGDHTATFQDSAPLAPIREAIMRP